MLLRIYKFMIFLMIGLFISAFAAKPQTSTEFNPEQTKQIQKIVHDYLLKNPEIMVDVFAKLREQQQQAMMKKAETAIKHNAVELFNNKTSPVIGNKEGKVVLVEFFDYQCPHCKDVYPMIDNLVAENPNLKVVLKEYPIFPGSEYPARAALAAKDEGKYEAFHEELLKLDDPITEAKVDAVAEKLGFDTEKLKENMQSNTVNQELKTNNELAQNVGVLGTPSFIIASYDPKTKKLGKYFFVPGVVSQGALQKLIHEVKKG